MSPSLDNIVPKLVENLNIYTLKITPHEAFVLTMIDGYTTVAQLAAVCQQETETLTPMLMKLASLGAIVLPAPSNVLSSIAPPPVTADIPKNTVDKSDLPTRTKAITAPIFPTTVDLDSELQQEIEKLLALGKLVNPFILMGLTSAARTADIKKSYFLLAKKFHPDRFYGRELGEYKNKLDMLFQRINQAYMILCDEKKRELYREELIRKEKLVPPASVNRSADVSNARPVTAPFSSPITKPVSAPVVTAARTAATSAPVVSKPAATYSAAPVTGRYSTEELEARRRSILNERRQLNNPFNDRTEKAEQIIAKGIKKLKEGYLLAPSESFKLAQQLMPGDGFYNSLRKSFAFNESHPAYNDLLKIEVLITSGYFDQALQNYGTLAKANYMLGAFPCMCSLLHFRLGHPVEAMAAANKAVGVEPDQLIYLLLACQIAVACKDNTGKEYYWKRATALANKFGCDIATIGPLMAIH